VPPLRALASLIIGLTVVCALAWPLPTPFPDDLGTAHAQAKKRTTLRKPPPKAAPKAAPAAQLPARRV
jgi:hypothetical protein